MRNVILVVGPPCAGKTTWVKQHASPDDLIIDWDMLAQETGSPVEHDHDETFARQASVRREQLETYVAAMEHGAAFVIRTLPNPRYRNDVFHRLNATQLKIIDPGEPACIARALDANRSTTTIAAIHDWYKPQHFRR